MDGGGQAPLIDIQGLVKSFGGKQVLQGISLSVRAGETLVILGRSGSGKSVILRHIIGLLKPDAGRIRVDGEEVTGLSERRLRSVRRKVSMLFQSGALFDSLSVQENVAFPLREHTELGEEEIVERVREKLGMVDLRGVEELMPSSLSGGMRKRVALARAIALEPLAILYDEPTTGLDPIVTGRIIQLVRQLQQRLGITSVVVTHDIESALQVGDRIALLHRGRMDFQGTVEEARQAPAGNLRDFFEGREG